MIEQANPTLDSLYGLARSLSMIEIHLTAHDPRDPMVVRAKYNIKNRFWIPRIFVHSFNILVTKKRVYVGQSWFRVSDYKIIHRFSHPRFIRWLDRLKRRIARYNTNPRALFDMFGYFDMVGTDHSTARDTERLFDYIKDTAQYDTTIIIKTLARPAK
jgi:hypothetical protein